MRGCVSAGMIAAVSTLGLMDTFDAVYGSSAGSLIGAYAIAGQVLSALAVGLNLASFVSLNSPLYEHASRLGRRQ